MTPAALVDHLVGVVHRAAPTAVAGAAHAFAGLRVAVDGPAPTEPAALADSLVGPLRALGRSVVRVSAEDFLRPASVRWERGRRDPDSFYEHRLDVGALAREVVDPMGPGGTGRYLPSLWDVERDRATRAGYATAAAGGVLLLDGSLLLGRWLDLDLTIHLALRPASLARRMPADEHWSLPAFARYADEVQPEEVADVVIRVDDPRHPAVVRRS